jgi:effector protein SdbA
MIGCSGGGGHNTAIKGIIDDYYAQKKITHKKSYPALVRYSPVEEKERESCSRANLIHAGLTFMSIPVIGSCIKSILFYTYLPALPDKELVMDEVKVLVSDDREREYIDMLLDVYPAGHESAAIWNILQRNDQTQDLKKLLALQGKNDEDNCEIIFTFYTNILKKAALEGDPFTEIISTQAMGLPALCDAVIFYNTWIREENRSDPEITIHQYMTDLATEGAVHFFHPLSKLNSQQQAQMKLYGIEMTKGINNTYLSRHSFQDVMDIPPKNNPMVRSGFKDPNFDHSQSFDREVTLILDGEDKPFIIKPYENIVSIMLGSQAGNDSFEYITSCLESGAEKVFVFGGKSNPILYSRIFELIASNLEKYEGKIIPLNHQSDCPIAALMSRSNTVIIRGGGLTVMEQMAMNHSSEQSIFIHHPDSSHGSLTSGIIWEDHNVEKLIKFLHKKNIYSAKISPALASRYLHRHHD